MEIRIDDRGLKKKLDELGRKVKDMRPVMRDISLIMRKAVWENFNAEGRDKKGNRGVWKELAESTQKQRARIKGELYKAHPILELTGTLKKSMSPSHGKDYAKVSSAKQYGVYHQTGTRKMPARPFLVLPKPVIEQIKAYITKYLLERS